jgi:hypothetical protein
MQENKACLLCRRFTERRTGTQELFMYLRSLSTWRRRATGYFKTDKSFSIGVNTMTPNYPQLVADTVSELPVTRQAEVYHFAQFMKKEKKIETKKKALAGSSVFDLFGSATSKVTDASVKHDRYLYE